jgi:hypothetical protein
MALEPNTLCDPEAKRMFGEAFPASLQLNHFKSMRKDSCDYTCDFQCVGIDGPTPDLVSSGLIAAELLPPGRKRVVFHWLGEPHRSTHVCLRRKRGDILDATFHIADDDSLPPAHPLQMFHPRRWPFGDRRAQRRYFDEYRERQSGALEGLFMALEYLAATEQNGYKVHPGDTARMQQMVAQFRTQFRHAFATARIVAEQAPQLQLAVNDRSGG